MLVILWFESANLCVCIMVTICYWASFCRIILTPEDFDMRGKLTTEGKNLLLLREKLTT